MGVVTERYPIVVVSAASYHMESPGILAGANDVFSVMVILLVAPVALVAVIVMI